MDSIAFEKRWETISDQYYLKDTTFEKSTHRDFNRLTEAVQIIARYTKGYCGAEHDILYLGGVLNDLIYDTITDKDIMRLCELGIHFETDIERFACFC